MVCKKCKSNKRVKNGMVRGHQRYKCKNCGYNYTETPPRGKPPEMKALAILLYTMGNASLGMIGKILKVSTVSVLRWVRQEGQKLKKPEIIPGDKYIMIDEMWHFVNGKKTKFGSGKPLILCQKELSPGNWAGVMLERSKSF
jgi:hypothetical protein